MRGLTKHSTPGDEGENKSISYYLDQLNLIYAEKSKKVWLWDEMDDEEKLVFMARLLRILQSEADIPLAAFIEKALLEINAPEENIRAAIRDLLSADLVSVVDGKIQLTDSGAELLSEE